jgi:hypothetical protein
MRADGDNRKGLKRTPSRKIAGLLALLSWLSAVLDSKRTKRLRFLMPHLGLFVRIEVKPE